MADDKRKGGSRRLEMVGPPADAQELQPDPSETVGSGNMEKILLDPDEDAKRDAEKYRLLQAAAQRNCAAAPSVASQTFPIRTMGEVSGPPIDPFAVLSNEQIGQVLRSTRHWPCFTQLSRGRDKRCLDAVRLAQDSAWLHAAPAAKLVSAATACAKTYSVLPKEPDTSANSAPQPCM
jgi:hypothetical protein